MKYFIWTVLSLMSVMVYGQNWVEVRDQGGSLDEIKQAFEEEWGDQEYEKGKGWKCNWYGHPKVDSCLGVSQTTTWV